MNLKLTGVGSDPEFFLSDGQRIVSAIGKVGGTKKTPKMLGAPDFFIQEDNVLVELNIPPAKSSKELADNMARGLKLVRAVLPKNHDLVIKASHELDPRQLRHPKAQQFGCEPEFIAWTSEMYTADLDLDRPNLRTSSGHVHVGYSPYEEIQDKRTNFSIAQLLDIFLGLPSVLLDPDRERRRLYGKAGSFRHKPYGLEYRTLSSFWTVDPILCMWVYNQVELAIQALNDGVNKKLSYVDGYNISTAINFYDTILAQELIEKYDVKLP